MPRIRSTCRRASPPPGVEAKELFRPLNQLSLQAQVTDTVSVAAQLMLEWESFRYPEGGTYYGPVDFAFNGPDRQFISPALGFAARGGAVEPHQTASGAWRRAGARRGSTAPSASTTATSPTSCRRPSSRRSAPNNSRYNLIYADDVDLFGISLAKNIAGVSVGAEVSYRHNTPLSSPVLGVSPGIPSEGNTNGPRGDTVHALVNGVGTIPKTPVFDSASWAAELIWSHWTKVSSGQNLFNAVGYAPCLPWPTAGHVRATSTSGTAAPPRTSSAWASPSRRPGSRCSRASTSRRR